MIDKKFAMDLAKDLTKVLSKHLKKANDLFTEEPYVILDGEKVTDEDDIREAYGGGFITRKTYEKLVHELQQKQSIRDGSREEYGKVLMALSDFIRSVQDTTLTEEEKRAREAAEVEYLRKRMEVRSSQ